MTQILGLSLVQPWATLLATGEKRFETRSWATGYRGLVAIHASKKFPVHAMTLCYENGCYRTALRKHAHNAISARSILPPLPLGQIIGVAKLMRCVPTSDVRFTIGPDESAFGDFGMLRFAWEFEWAELLPTPFGINGMLGLWSLPNSARALVLGQLAKIQLDADPCLAEGRA